MVETKLACFTQGVVIRVDNKVRGKICREATYIFLVRNNFVVSVSSSTQREEEIVFLILDGDYQKGS